MEGGLHLWKGKTFCQALTFATHVAIIEGRIDNDCLFANMSAIKSIGDFKGVELSCPVATPATDSDLRVLT